MKEGSSPPAKKCGRASQTEAAPKRGGFLLERIAQMQQLLEEIRRTEPGAWAIVALIVGGVIFAKPILRLVVQLWEVLQW